MVGDIVVFCTFEILQFPEFLHLTEICISCRSQSHIKNAGGVLYIITTKKDLKYSHNGDF